MPIPNPETPTLTEMVNKELDKQYNQTAGNILQQIESVTASPSAPVQRELSELEDEVERLDQQGNPITIDSPFVKIVLASIYDVFKFAQTMISAGAERIERTGLDMALSSVTAKVFVQTGRHPDASDIIGNPQAALARANGTQWKLPQIQSPIAGTEAWRAKMNTWAQGYSDLVNNTLRDKLATGTSSQDVTAWLRGTAQNLPYVATENLTRTLQLTAYRQASHAVEEANDWLIAYKIRVAQLDNRTCLACIALHGSMLAIGQAVDDHYRGRCDAYYVILGGRDKPEYMRADGVYVPFQTGEEWFAALPEERQAEQQSFAATPAKFNAYKAGNPLSSFVLHRHDDTFGQMVFENSVIGAFGDDAENYYVR